MALAKRTDIISALGDTISIENTYLKITNISGCKASIICHYNIFKSKKELICITTGSFEFVPTLEGDNFIKQAYEHLRTLEEFKDVEDV